MRLQGLPLPRLAATFTVFCTLAITAGGCKPQSHELMPGSYRGVVELPGGEVPFGLDVAREESGFVLYLVNDKERVRVAASTTTAGKLTARLPGSGDLLEARISGGDLEGEVTLSAAGGRKTVLRFSAALGQHWRFIEESLTDNADFAGRWSVTFTDDAGKKIPGVAEFRQSFASLTGAVRTAAWEQKPLAGDAHDEELSLSLFDGTQAVLYHGKLNQRGELVGERWSTSAGHARYTAKRNPDATL
jgi:hypothetical protein